MGKGLAALLAVVGFILALARPAIAQPLLSLAEFRDRVAAEVRRDQPGATIRSLGQVGLRVEPPGEDPKEQTFERAYAFYREEPHRLDEYAGVLAASYRPLAVTPESLLVLVRRQTSNPPPGPAGPGDRGLTRPLAGDLIAIVAVDAPDNYEFLRASVLREKLRLANAAIWARAQANTREAIPYEPRPLPPGRAVKIESGKGLSSSLLANDAFWDAPVITAGGPVVIAALARDTLFAALLSDTAAVAGLRKMMSEVADDPNTLFPDLLVRRDGRWETLP